MSTITENTIYYFQMFEIENMEQLKNLYADTVSLIDWTGQWDGKENVLNANRAFFDANDFTVIRKETDVCGNKTFNRIEIQIHGGETLDVMDVITFDSDNKIFEIKAYKC